MCEICHYNIFQSNFGTLLVLKDSFWEFFWPRSILVYNADCLLKDLHSTKNIPTALHNPEKQSMNINLLCAPTNG